jgi:hypothetical protein
MEYRNTDTFCLFCFLIVELSHLCYLNQPRLSNYSSLIKACGCNTIRFELSEWVFQILSYHTFVFTIWFRTRSKLSSANCIYPLYDTVRFNLRARYGDLLRFAALHQGSTCMISNLNHVTAMRLTINMRLLAQVTLISIAQHMYTRHFADWFLQVGDGNINGIDDIIPLSSDSLSLYDLI